MFKQRHRTGHVVSALPQQFFPAHRIDRRGRQNIAQAAGRIRKTQYPQAEQTAQNVLQPPSEGEMFKQFTQMEVK